MTYTKALEELQKINQQLESEMLNLDQMEKLLERSAELMAICKDSLRRVSDKLNEFQAGQNEA